MDVFAINNIKIIFYNIRLHTIFYNIRLYTIFYLKC